MKYFLAFILIFIMLFPGCIYKDSTLIDDNINSISKIEVNSQEISSDDKTSSEEIKTETPDMTNLTYDNRKGKMGDVDGPAYAVYSKKGYNKASIEVLLSQIKVNNVRKSDNKFVNAYIFLGIDIYNSDGEWVNCLDTGLCYSGINGGWHLFYNLYTTETKGINKWYESEVILDPSHDYKLTLDSSKQDGKSTVTIYDLTDKKEADRIEFESAYSLTDGSNTSYLQNYALDYPDDVKLDTKGNKSDNDFVEITLYNTDENLYMNNITIQNAKLYNSAEFTWAEENTQNRSMWPDKNISKIDYEVVKVWVDTLDKSFTLSLNMNRNK